jgi:hypothetical protein
MSKNNNKEIEMTFATASIPTPVLFDEFLIEDAILDGATEIMWCEHCKVWMWMREDHGYALPACWCA